MGVLDGMEKLVNSEQVTEAMVGLAVFLDEAGELLESVNGDMPKIRSEFSRLSSDAASAITQARSTLEQYQALVAEGSPVEYELRHSLSEVRAAARSMRVFADYIERHPEALLQGKK